jgi:hypothetical protein
MISYKNHGWTNDVTNPLKERHCYTLLQKWRHPNETFHAFINIIHISSCQRILQCNKNHSIIFHDKNKCLKWSTPSLLQTRTIFIVCRQHTQQTPLILATWVSMLALSSTRLCGFVLHTCSLDGLRERNQWVTNLVIWWGGGGGGGIFL